MNSTRHFILGLLSQRPMSGYDIKRHLKGLVWLVGSPSFGTLYPALHALVEDGLAVVEVVPKTGKPARNVYTITGQGHRALHDWVARPPGSEVSLKSFVMRLFVADALPRDGLVATLEQRRETVATHRVAMQGAARGENGGSDASQRVALDYGLDIADAELAWLDKQLAVLLPASSETKDDVAD